MGYVLNLLDPKTNKYVEVPAIRGEKGDSVTTSVSENTTYSYKLKFEGQNTLVTPNLIGCRIFAGIDISGKASKGIEIEINDSKVGDYYLNTSSCYLYQRTDQNPSTKAAAKNTWVLAAILKGETGDPGVYVGATEPTDDDVKVWINPEGDYNEVVADEKTIKSDGDILTVNLDGETVYYDSKADLIKSTVAIDEETIIRDDDDKLTVPIDNETIAVEDGVLVADSTPFLVTLASDATSVEMEWGRVYVSPELAKLAITTAAVPDDKRYHETTLILKCAGTATEFTFPSNILWETIPSIEEGNYYEIKINSLRMGTIRAFS